MSCCTSVVHDAEEGTDSSKSKGRGASQNKTDVCAAIRIHVPVVGEVFYCFDSLDFAEHLLVCFFFVVVVSVHMCVAVTSHDYFY